ncbi:MAG: GNAT family N-acetyltransferase [Candidatus Cryptobacteroides sp.]
MEIITRNALPQDAASIAPLLINAWPVDAFLAMGEGLTVDDLMDIVTGLVASEDNLYSYRNTIVAESVDGPHKTVVGAMTGYDGALYESLRKPVEETISVFFEKRGIVSKGFPSWCPETGPGEFYLDSVGVDAQCRSMGIGSLLFKAMLDRAASEGHKVAGLIVDEDKPAAERLYLRLGFEFAGNKNFCGHLMRHLQKRL